MLCVCISRLTADQSLKLKSLQLIICNIFLEHKRNFYFSRHAIQSISFLCCPIGKKNIFVFLYLPLSSRSMMTELVQNTNCAVEPRHLQRGNRLRQKSSTQLSTFETETEKLKRQILRSVHPYLYLQNYTADINIFCHIWQRKRVI